MAKVIELRQRHELVAALTFQRSALASVLRQHSVRASLTSRFRTNGPRPTLGALLWLPLYAIDRVAQVIYGSPAFWFLGTLVNRSDQDPPDNFLAAEGTYSGD